MKTHKSRHAKLLFLLFHLHWHLTLPAFTLRICGLLLLVELLVDMIKVRVPWTYADHKLMFSEVDIVTTHISDIVLSILFAALSFR